MGLDDDVVMTVEDVVDELDDVEVVVVVGATLREPTDTADV